jgi:prephenate dehydrogenase
MIRRITICGLGLIGGSLAMAWKRTRPELHLTAFDRRDVLVKARELGVVDATSEDVAEAVAQADLVVLAAPLQGILYLIEEIGPHLQPGTRVTDVGGVKQPILAHAEALLPDTVTFIGGHPMAGSERRGLANADPFLFENATYVLCPPRTLTTQTLQTQHADFLELIRALGARILILDATRHDTIAAAVSHLPQLLAVLLVNTAAELSKGEDAFFRLAAGGFRDMTRIASSPFDLWRDVLFANEGPLLDALGHFAANLQRLRNRLIEEDAEALGEAFEQARQLRERIPRDSKGFLHPLADVYVRIEDRPGALFRITQALYEAGLNIQDIELLKVREGTGGTFRLGFATEADADLACQVLRKANIEARKPEEA